MTTTSRTSARKLLAEVDASDLSVALLHGDYSEGAEGAWSDIDLVARGQLGEIVPRLRDLAERVGLRPALIWPYDVNAVTVLFLSHPPVVPLGSVQIDLLSDPRGVGKYGIRSDELLARAVPDSPLARVHPLDETLYLWRKARRKGQVRRQRRCDERLQAYAPEQVAVRCAELFAWGSIPATPTRRWSSRFLARLGRYLLTARRIVWRLRCPIGVEVTVGSRQEASDLKEVFGEAFPVVEIRHRWQVVSRVVARRRPGISLVIRRDAPPVRISDILDELRTVYDHNERLSL